MEDPVGEGVLGDRRAAGELREVAVSGGQVVEEARDLEADALRRRGAGEGGGERDAVFLDEVSVDEGAGAGLVLGRDLHLGDEVGEGGGPGGELVGGEGSVVVAVEGGREREQVAACEGEFGGDLAAAELVEAA